MADGPEGLRLPVGRAEPAGGPASGEHLARVRRGLPGRIRLDWHARPDRISRGDGGAGFSRTARGTSAAGAEHATGCRGRIAAGVPFRYGDRNGCPYVLRNGYRPATAS